MQIDHPFECRTVRYPVLCIVGWSRSGKDTACEWLRDNTVLKFNGSSSWVMRHVVAAKLGLDPDEAFARRHEHREKWKSILDDYRKEDSARCIRECVKDAQLLCGIRDIKELVAGRAAGLFDLAIWVNNPRVGYDSTCTFAESDCDLTINNDGSLEDYHRKLRRLATSMGVCR